MDAMSLSFLDHVDVRELPLPMDRSFTTAEGIDLLDGRHALRVLCRRGMVATPLRGVHHLAGIADTLALRIDCVRRVAPDDAVVCDRTAGWLHGAPRILAPGDHLAVPQPSLFLPETGRRLRRGAVRSGSRAFAADDLVDVGGVLVTTPLRTALDLGRLLHRDQALAALDSMLRTGAFSRDRLVAEVVRFKGMRGVCQLRDLAPHADGRSESPGESILRLRWLDCPDLPPPELQVPVEVPWTTYAVDLGLPDLCFGAEYYGEEWHGPEQAAHDAHRLQAMQTHRGWCLEVFLGANIHGPGQDADLILRRALLPLLASRRTTIV